MPEEASMANFEQELARVERVVRELEDGKISLAESLARYEEGIRALRNCQNLLDQADARIEILTRGEDGTPRLEPGALSAGAVIAQPRPPGASSH